MMRADFRGAFLEAQRYYEKKHEIKEHERELKGKDKNKCKYYFREAPDESITGCGNSAEYEYVKFCTFCGKKIMESHSAPPQSVIEKYESNDD